ncbi:triphosphoribosyl-dephospho-CoA synthase [Geomicrobium sp. JSM 1781026]|uniref:triphosphoribosyl-dephospho-CoA synthase n=1 Tax=Geomicrobium sp. JSM 1781026 TaxID=3344580 RepID=UPI0035C08930
MSVATAELSRQKLREHVTHAAQFALREELALTFKPGLIDQANNGAHYDMDYQMMEASCNVIAPYFGVMAELAYRQQPSFQLREQLAEIGLEAERKMLHVTGGVNTHRGAIWCIGLLAASYAMGMGSPTSILNRAGNLARIELKSPSERSNGQDVFHQHGVLGAKGEAQSGFPHVQLALRPLPLAHRSLLPQHVRLLTIMRNLMDTCVIHRTGMAGLRYAQIQSQHALNGTLTLEELDQQFINRNISPGGSADLYAASLFIEKLGGSNDGRVSVHI